MPKYDNIKLEEYSKHEAEQMKLYTEYSHKLTDLREEYAEKIAQLTQQFNGKMSRLNQIIGKDTDYTPYNDTSNADTAREIINNYLAEKRKISDKYSMEIKTYLEKILDLDVIEVNGKRYIKSYYLNYDKLYGISDIDIEE